MRELLLDGLWYINGDYATRLREMVITRISKGLTPIPIEAKLPVYDQNDEWIPEASYLNNALKKGMNSGVAVIDIKGSMSRDGYCSYGNDFIRGAIEYGVKTDEIKGFVFRMNTPGGTVDSTDTLADAIKNCPKPTVAYVASMAASAGYFVASQTDHIIMENSITSEVGSIGVLLVHTNIQKQLEKEGVEVTIFRATDSVDKARFNSIEPLTDEQTAQLQTSLDESLKVFKGYVKRGRAGKLLSDEVFTGKMYDKKEAIKLGLADAVGTINDAIQFILKQ